MAVKAIFFDSGNVLVKEGFTPGIPLFEQKLNIPKGLLYQSCHDRPYWKEFTLGLISEDAYLAKVQENFKGELNIQELKKTIYENSLPYTDVIEYAKSLKPKYFLGIISNNPKEWFDYFWNNFGWSDIFSSKSVSAELHVRKPDLKIFQDALNKAGVKGEESIYIDDRAEKAEPAKELGFNIIIFKNLGQLKKDIIKYL